MATVPVKDHAAVTSTTPSGWAGARVRPLVITLAVGLGVWLVPALGGVEPAAWHLFAMFLATIVGIIAKPLPMGAVAIIGIAVTALTGTLPIGDALNGFGNSTIWFTPSHNILNTCVHFVMADMD